VLPKSLKSPVDVKETSLSLTSITCVSERRSQKGSKGVLVGAKIGPARRDRMRKV